MKSNKDKSSSTLKVWVCLLSHFVKNKKTTYVKSLYHCSNTKTYRQIDITFTFKAFSITYNELVHSIFNILLQYLVLPHLPPLHTKNNTNPNIKSRVNMRGKIFLWQKRGNVDTCEQQRRKNNVIPSRHCLIFSVFSKWNWNRENIC